MLEWVLLLPKVAHVKKLFTVNYESQYFRIYKELKELVSNLIWCLDSNLHIMTHHERKIIVKIVQEPVNAN